MSDSKILRAVVRLILSPFAIAGHPYDGTAFFDAINDAKARKNAARRQLDLARTELAKIPTYINVSRNCDGQPVATGTADKA